MSSTSRPAVPCRPTLRLRRARICARWRSAYPAALAAIFPDREIWVSLLYSTAPRLIDLPDALLASHKPGFVPAQEKLWSRDLEGQSRVH